MRKFLLIFALLLALASAGHAADWDRTRVQDVTIKARSGTATTSISATTVGGLVLAPKTGQGAALGYDAKGAQSLTLHSGTTGKNLAAYTDADGFAFFTSQKAMSLTTLEYVRLTSGATQPQYFDAGGLFTFRDQDASFATRATINSANGDINSIGGAYLTSGTTRLAANGNATLTTTTITGSVTATGNISGPKTRSTIEGGRAILLTNRTGAATIKGTVVCASQTYDNAFAVAPIDSDFPAGVVYESGIANGQEAWIVTGGIGQVLWKDATAAARGNVAYAGDTAGRAEASATLPSVTLHNREIGHTIESTSASTNVLVRCILHFN